MPSLEEVARFASDAAVIGIDMPIGLLSVAVSGGRACDRAARARLGGRAGSSVFSPPCRAALDARDYRSALALQRATAPEAPGLSLQAFHIFPKLREADAHVRREGQSRWREVHPELAFRALAGTILPKKRRAAGRAARERVLAEAGLIVPATRLPGAGRDDLLDACAAAWSARRIANGTAERVPSDAVIDAMGLRMEIWW